MFRFRNSTSKYRISVLSRGKGCSNVKRWHPGDQRERWVGSGLLIAEKGNSVQSVIGSEVSVR